MCFNSFLAKDYLNDSNQDPDINFYNDIFSIDTSYLLSCEATKKLKHFSLETFYNSLNVCFSIICLSETWVNDNKPEKKLLGIAIFIRDSLLHKIREDLNINCDDIESLSIKIINNHSKNIILNEVYRPPDGKPKYNWNLSQKNSFWKYQS